MFLKREEFSNALYPQLNYLLFNPSNEIFFNGIMLNAEDIFGAGAVSGMTNEPVNG